MKANHNDTIIPPPTATDGSNQPPKVICVKGKPICQCRFSDEQHVKLANLLNGKFKCTFKAMDPKLVETYEAVRAVVADASTVSIEAGPCEKVMSHQLLVKQFGVEAAAKITEAMSSAVELMKAAAAKKSTPTDDESKVAPNNDAYVGRIPKKLLDDFGKPPADSNN